MGSTLSSNAWLLDGSRHEPSDMHVRSGYPIWQLIDVWYARKQSDEAVLQEYALAPEEWAAARAYYGLHRKEIDARRTRNNEPGTPLPGAITLEELLTEQSER